MKVRKDKNKIKRCCYWLRFSKPYPEQYNDDVIMVTDRRCHKTGGFCDKEDPDKCPVKNLKKRGKK